MPVSVSVAKCPSCGADIRVPNGATTVPCTFCRKDVLVARDSAAAKSDNRMRLADAALRAGNYDEAYSYYTLVLEDAPEDHRAWYGKAVAAGWGSALRADRFAELTAGIDFALEHAPEGGRSAIARRAAADINQIATAYFNLSRKHTAEFISLDTTWAEHVERCIPILMTLSRANELDPTNRVVVENAIEISKGMIEGVEYCDEFDTDDHGIPAVRTKHLSPQLEARVRDVMNSFVEKLKAMDPAYVAPKVVKAGSTSTLTWVATGLVVLAFIGFGVWRLRKDIWPEVTRGAAQSAMPSAPQVAPPVADEAVRTTACGDPSHRPKSASAYREWTRWSCKSQQEAGPSWSRCLQRSAYSDSEGQGCSGSARCCPP